MPPVLARHPSSSPIIIPNPNPTHIARAQARARSRPSPRAHNPALENLFGDSEEDDPGMDSEAVDSPDEGDDEPEEIVEAGRERDRAVYSSISPIPSFSHSVNRRRRAELLLRDSPMGSESDDLDYHPENEGARGGGGGVGDEDDDDVAPLSPEVTPPPLPITPPRINRTIHSARRPQHAGGTIVIGNSSPGGSTGSGHSSPPSYAGTNRPRGMESHGSDESIVALNDEEVAALDHGRGGGRRYTAAEKGKGRAVVSAQTVVVDGKGKGKKRKSEVEEEMEGQGGKKRVGGRVKIEDGAVDVTDLRDDGVDITMDDEEVEEEEEEEGEFLDEFSCPVCFCSLTRPVATLCGHILCSDCLHSSLLSAIGRNPNPLPAAFHALHHAGPAPRAPPRTGRPTYTRTKAKSDPVHNASPESADAQPSEWTLAALQAKVSLERKREREELERAAEIQFAAAELPEESWEAAKIGLGIIGEEAEGEEESGGKGLVVEVLKGLWRIPGGTVVEGECPVCRNAIPGGMGPFGSGVGSVTPLFAVMKM